MVIAWEQAAFMFTCLSSDCSISRTRKAYLHGPLIEVLYFWSSHSPLPYLWVVRNKHAASGNLYLSCFSLLPYSLRIHDYIHTFVYLLSWIQAQWTERLPDAS
jgi:hypothetical protein